MIINIIWYNEAVKPRFVVKYVQFIHIGFIRTIASRFHVNVIVYIPMIDKQNFPFIFRVKIFPLSRKRSPLQSQEPLRPKIEPKSIHYLIHIPIRLRFKMPEKVKRKKKSFILVYSRLCCIKIGPRIRPQAPDTVCLFDKILVIFQKYNNNERQKRVPGLLKIIASGEIFLRDIFWFIAEFMSLLSPMCDVWPFLLWVREGMVEFHCLK